MASDNDSDGWFMLTRGMAMPWHCDHYGHMNVRWYGHFFDDATLLIFTQIGVDMRELHAAGAHTVIAKSTVEYLHEVRAGDPLEVHGAFVRLGEKSVTVTLRMQDAAGRGIRARQETVIVFFDPQSRRSTRIPDQCRQRVAAVVVAPDAGAS